MKYPAIVYSRYDIENLHADNRPYISAPAYQVTVIDKNPDSNIVEKISQMEGCRYNRGYRADNLNHDVFIIYV